MIKHVVVPIDGSEHADRALLPAVEIARRFDAQLVLLQAAHPDDFGEAHQQLEDRVLRSRFENTEIVVNTLVGPVGALEELVNERPQSLVCMTTHGRSGLGRALFGSVAEEALREISVPFVLVGPNTDLVAGIGGPILVALDGSPRSERVLAEASGWAKALNVGIWLVLVVDPAEAEQAVAAHEDMEESAYVARVARSVEGAVPSVNWEVLRSADPAHAIVEFAEKKNLRVVAMATHGRSGLARIAVGSVATRIIHDHDGVALVIRASD